MGNGTVTILNTTPYKLQPVPEVGKEYHIFDDGKVRLSRHYIAEVQKLIYPDEAYKMTDLYKAWEEQVRECYWLFAQNTDYFVEATSSYDANPLYFVRTVDGGWFSIDYPNPWMGARLDIDGSLYNNMMESYKEGRA